MVLTALVAFLSAQAPLVDDCGLEPPGAPILPVPTKPYERPWDPTEPPQVTRVRPSIRPIAGSSIPTAHRTDVGPLAGKTVYLSAGHGLTWVASLNGWRGQRGNTNGIVEDLVSTETFHQFLVPMLLNMGAQVVTVREADLNPALAVVDDGTAGYQEQGEASLFSDSTVAGWGQHPVPLPDGTNPFALGKNRLLTAAATATASARYTVTFPADGYYNAYVSYSAFTARVTDAHYVVHHAGGQTHFRVNQRRRGSTWALLGRFYFKAGARLAVEVLNDSKESGNISLDAVRFGGGVGLADRGGGRSGRPRFEENSRYNAHYSGAPTTVYDARVVDADDDVVTRSRFTAWVHEPGEDAVYLAWHTNAANGTAQGTETYVYGTNPPNGAYMFSGVAGSDRLARLVHGELINDFKAPTGWNRPTWPDRGVRSAYFGELNPDHNNEVPSILMELAFHDTPADAAHLKEPKFRYLASRAIAQGIVRYFAEKDGVAPRFFSEPPTNVRAVAKDGVVTVSWKPGPVDTEGVAGSAATSYLVATSADGLGWDDGTPATGTSLELPLPAGTTRYYRVIGVNAGGESFPSTVVGARSASPGEKTALLVSSFDRLDAAMARSDNLSAYALGNILRIILPRLNDGAQLRRPGEALDFAKVAFDGASSEAVADGDVVLTPYAMVGWFSGRGHSATSVLTTAERTALAAYAQSGKPVLFSGATAARSLAAGPAAEGMFLTDVLRAGASGTAQTGVGGAAGQFLEGVPALALDDGLQGSPDPGPGDVLTAQGAAVAIARWADGGVAGVAADRSLVYLGFPFEAVTSRTARLDVMGRVLAYFQVLPTPPVIPDGGDEPPFDAGLEEPGTDGGTVSPDGGTEVRFPVLPSVYGDEMAKGGCGCNAGGLGFGLLALAAWVRRRQKTLINRS